jgi:hypothetical protein
MSYAAWPPFATTIRTEGLPRVSGAPEPRRVETSTPSRVSVEPTERTPIFLEKAHLSAGGWRTLRKVELL